MAARQLQLDNPGAGLSHRSIVMAIKDLEIRFPHTGCTRCLWNCKEYAPKNLDYELEKLYRGEQTAWVLPKVSTRTLWTRRDPWNIEKLGPLRPRDRWGHSCIQQ